MNTILHNLMIGFMLMLQSSGIGGAAKVGGVGSLGGGFTAGPSGPTIPSGGSCSVDSTTTVTSMTCTPAASANASGDLIYIGVNWADNQVPVCSDATGNTVTQNPDTSPAGVWPPAGNNSFYSYTVAVTTSGSHAITCNLPSHTPGDNPWLVVALIRGTSGRDTGSFLGVSSGTFAGGDFSGTAVTPTHNNSLIIITCATDHRDPTTINSPSTTLEHPTVNNGGWFSMGYTTANAVSSAPLCHNPFSNNVMANYGVYQP